MRIIGISAAFVALGALAACSPVQQAKFGVERNCKANFAKEGVDKAEAASRCKCLIEELDKAYSDEQWTRAAEIARQGDNAEVLLRDLGLAPALVAAGFACAPTGP